MLFHLLTPLSEQFTPFNLFRYITFRSGGAVVTALLISFVAGPRVIAWLKSQQAEGQPIRLDGPESHLIRKKGTPTMGGFLILLAVTVSTLLWADLSNGYVRVVLFAEQIAAGNLSARIAESSTDEIGKVASALDHTARQWEESFFVLQRS